MGQVFNYHIPDIGIYASRPAPSNPRCLGRIISILARLIGFDADGRIIKNTDGNGNVITGTWGGASGDIEGLDGLLKSVQYPSYREDYKFDNRNRKTQVSRILDATTKYTSSSEYDACGNVITQIDALNRKTRIDFENLIRSQSLELVSTIRTR